MTDSPASLRAQVTGGVAWMLTARLAVKALGLVNTLVLVRLLTPEDFGLVAMAMIVVGFSQVLFSLGIDTALIQNPGAERAHFDTAWTIGIVQGALVAGALFSVAPLAQAYYGEPRVVAVLNALAIGVLLQGLTNIGVVAFRKDLQFAREFRFQFASKLLSVAATVTVALWLRDYRALVFGIVAGNVLSVLLSYAVSRYRPRLSFAKAREIWGFSQWLLVTNIGYYAYTRADQFIIGGTVGKANLGTYSVAAEVAELPTTEVIAALSRVVLPGLAKIKGEPARLTEAFLRVHGVTASLVFPAAAGLAVTAPELVPVLLGDKWLQSVTVLQWLAVYTGLRTLYGSVGNLMIVKGAMSTLALVTWLELLAIVGSTLVGGYLGGLVGIAAAKVVLACGMAIVWYGLARSRCQVPLGAVLSTFARPALATLGMVGVVVAVSSVAGGPAPLRLLLLKSLLGVLSYVALLAVTWHLWCRPDGPERAVVDLLARLLHPASHR